MDFVKQPLFSPHQNPAARLSSSLKHHQDHSLDRAYLGLDFLWALTPSKGDYILLNFSQPLHIHRYLFRSGDVETSLDRFYNTTVEVRPSSELKSKHTSGFSLTPDGFFVVGRFDKGRAEGRVNETLQPVSALRLMVQQDSDFWVMLKEIFIEV
uniref:MGAT4 A/B/C C-terminal domain-containing protein n=1 Tax=Knipowitschia caucasica TaxID=637954 RepID=A0AAV2MMG2_KNICA